MEREPVTVSELTKYIKERLMIDPLLNKVYIKGEISNFTNHYSGHLYFTLKDEQAIIKCVMFKNYTQGLKFVPKDGTKVIVYGNISVFEKGGSYQINCMQMQEEGIGDLHKAFEELKQRLEKEGLFDPSHKKQIPFMPKAIGVITSQTGAVIRDIINVGTRRNPDLHLRLLPVPVQGEGAYKKIIQAIEYFNQEDKVEVIILARGGGSLEDLWNFNEEELARAIFQSSIPIISAIGHETDFTISDFVADLRAPTPSAAAELAVPSIVELQTKLTSYETRYKMLLKRKVEMMRLRYEKCMKTASFTNPLMRIHDQYMKLDFWSKSLQNSIQNKLKDGKNLAATKIAKIDTLSPLKTLARGYSIVQKESHSIRSIKDLKKEDEISLRLADGTVNAKVI